MAPKTASTKPARKTRTKPTPKTAVAVDAGAMAAETSAAETGTPEANGVKTPPQEAPEYSEVDIAAETSITNEVAATMQEAAAELPEEALSFLVRSVPAREAWQWLCEARNVELSQRITRGFQRTINTLRQPVVRTRLAHHLRETPDDLQIFLKLWSETPPQPHVVTDVREYSDDAALIERLPELWQNHGTEPLLLTLLIDNRQPVIDAWEQLVDVATDDTTSDDGPATLPGATVTEDSTEDAPSPIELLTTELDSVRAQAGSWQNKAKQWQQRAEAAESSLNATREAGRRDAEKLKRQVKHETLRADTAQAQVQENKRLLDRTARRLKSVEKELDEASTETKRLKRQIRRQQQLNEEIRKQLADVTARLEALSAPVEATTTTSQEKTAARDTKAPAGKAAVTAPAPARSKPVSPLDQLFIWQADGRQFKMTPRDVQRAIDRNDEDFVFTLIQSLDAMRENSEEGFRLLIARIREIGRYYSRVLVADTTRVLIDASNVARYEKDRYGKGQLRHLLAMRDELRRRDCFPILIYADASLPYNIDEPEELQKMVKNSEVQMTLSGQEADELLAREARRTGAYVVTNDRGFHLKVSPDFEPPRISFRIYDGVLIIDDF